MAITKVTDMRTGLVHSPHIDPKISARIIYIHSLRWDSYSPAENAEFLSMYNEWSEHHV